ncbi:hypothetical protein ACFQ78_28440 [Streptomyces sp. NPDC056519]|uniref:hypothetical protein n=1 Tax=Streptomyces sp. NPDC056519 TaxID=3345849 RepID=UPI00369A1551
MRLAAAESTRALPGTARPADTTLRRGGTVVLLDGFEAGAVLAAIARERISHLFLLSPLLYQLTCGAVHPR